MSRPTLFADLPFAAALAEVQAAGKVLLVDVGGSLPVNDVADIEAICAKALVIQIDAESHPDLGIKWTPLTISFRNGVEAERVFGVKNAGQVLAWIAALERGQGRADEADAVAAEARRRDSSTEMAAAIG